MRSEPLKMVPTRQGEHPRMRELPDVPGIPGDHPVALQPGRWRLSPIEPVEGFGRLTHALLSSLIMDCWTLDIDDALDYVSAHRMARPLTDQDTDLLAKFVLLIAWNAMDLNIAAPIHHDIRGKSCYPPQDSFAAAVR